MTALLEVAQGSLEEGLAKALLPHAQLRLFKGSVALLSAYAAGEINVFAGGGNVLVEVKASGVLMVNAMKCFARAFHLTCQVGALLLRRVIHQSPRALVAGGLFLRTGQGF